jgi:hypothetical protein
VSNPITKPALFLLACVFITSCTLIIGDVTGYAPDESVEAVNNKPTGCAVFVPPVVKPIPDVPYISDLTMNDRDASDTILVNKIDELRRYAKDLKVSYQKAYEQHLKSCH